MTDRLTRPTGTFYLPGLAALVRLAIDQMRHDQESGLRTRALVTGYPGSPLAGYDLQLQREQELLSQWGIVHQPAAAEERAVSALLGSQMLDRFPHDACDGVVGFWYGKGPGIDRSGDALKHANFAGTSALGAVVVLSGEDHRASSSTMPFQEDYAFASAGIPILYPSSVAEFVRFGRHAVEMSRFSGCWVALKLVAELCDGGQTMRVDPADPAPMVPRGLSIDGVPFRKRSDFTFYPGRNIDIERQLYRERHPAAIAYAAANGLDTVVGASSDDQLGIIATGKSYADMRQALHDCGVDDESLLASRLRILKIGMPYPLDRRLVAEFSSGLGSIIVVEEKRAFVEDQVKAALQEAGRTAAVVGKVDEAGQPLLPVEAGLDADLLVERLGERLAPHLPQPELLHRRRMQIKDVRERNYVPMAARTPTYCSGCPHSLSTRLPEDHRAWGSPGCHAFATVMEPGRQIEAMTHLGGEGLPWIGLAPFTSQQHMVQNVGDGSLWHSSYDNIRACVAANVNITFKILYNGAVANTGAQAAPGARSIPELTQLLAVEGVKEIALVTKQPKQYRRAALGAGTRVCRLPDIIDVQRRLAQVPGVTVLIYDESCANERRRQQKRQQLPAPNRFVLINERVCENCGDCGRKTNCMSLQKVATPFGPKTRIHTSSCNQDYTCLEGDCPSFVVVETRPGTGYAAPLASQPAAPPVPEPVRPAVAGAYRVLAPGVGGTGVLTLNAILATAAQLDGLEVTTYDQTGAAQKWGPVLSSLSIGTTADELWSNRIGLAAANLCLALDVVAATSPHNLDRLDAEHTATVVNTSLFPTAEMTRDANVTVDSDAALATLSEHSARVVTVPARDIAEALFGDYMMTNLVVLGVAYQSGLVPISASSIEQAIDLNGVAAERNKQAFRWGRVWTHQPSELAAYVPSADESEQRAAESSQPALSRRRRRAHQALMQRAPQLDASSRELLELRLADLIDYHSVRYASTFMDFVSEVAATERAHLSTQDITRAAIVNLHKLMAYKDEYEVARLYLQTQWRQHLNSTFAAPARVSYQFHPPVLRALGLRRKLSLGPWFTWVLRGLHRARTLRGTPFDPFGHAALRKTERSLPRWYRDSLRRALGRLSPDNHDVVVALAAVPDQIRGFETIKSDAIATAKAAAEELLARIERPPLPLVAVAAPNS